MSVSRWGRLVSMAPGADAGNLVIAYGESQGAFASVPLRPVGDLRVESWHLGEAAVDATGRWHRAASEDAVLLHTHVDGDDLIALTRQAYLELLDLVGSSRTPQLIRVWNYVRDINAVDDGLERYQRFSVGRFEALESAGFRLSDDLPAASAVGARTGPALTIIALASREAGTQVENPRQVSAWAYPTRYGPRSPSFSRATIETGPSGRRLWISGTASIVGHESVHPGDPIAQLDETMTNMEAVIREAGMTSGLASLTMLKVYVRRAGDFPLLKSKLESIAPGIPTLWVEADICREELLLEIEGCATD